MHRQVEGRPWNRASEMKADSAPGDLQAASRRDLGAGGRTGRVGPGGRPSRCDGVAALRGWARPLAIEELWCNVTLSSDSPWQREVLSVLTEIAGSLTAHRDGARWSSSGVLTHAPETVPAAKPAGDRGLLASSRRRARGSRTSPKRLRYLQWRHQSRPWPTTNVPGGQPKPESQPRLYQIGPLARKVPGRLPVPRPPSLQWCRDFLVEVAGGTSSGASWSAQTPVTQERRTISASR